MADLTDIQAAQSVKVIGSDSSGLETTPVSATSAGAMHVNMRNNAGTEIGVPGSPLIIEASATSESSVVDSGNSTTANLGIGATFTGTWVEVLGYANVSILVRANQSAAASGLKIEWSSNASTVDADDLFDHAGLHGDQFSFGVMARYFRVRYVNGSVAQTSFVLQTILHRVAFKASSHRVDDPIDADDDAELVKSTITGRASDGNYYNVKVDTEGRLVTSALTGFNANFCFGDIATSATTTVPVRRTTYTEQAANAQRSIASSSASDDGAPVGIGARTVRITYYTSTGSGPFTTDVILNGTAYVNTTATNICFIEKIQVLTAGSSTSNVGTLTLRAAITGGGAIMATINPGDNQTLWAHHYVALGKTCYITGASFGNDAIDIGNGALYTIRRRNIGETAELQISDFLRLYGADSGTHSRTYDSPIIVQGPALITMYVQPRTTTTMTQTAAFDFFEP